MTAYVYAPGQASNPDERFRNLPRFDLAAWLDAASEEDIVALAKEVNDDYDQSISILKLEGPVTDRIIDWAGKKNFDVLRLSQACREQRLTRRMQVQRKAFLSRVNEVVMSHACKHAVNTLLGT